jgi:hypothetical protein
MSISLRRALAIHIPFFKARQECLLMNEKREAIARRLKASTEENTRTARQLIVNSQELLATARELKATTKAIIERFHILRANGKS